MHILIHELTTEINMHEFKNKEPIFNQVHRGRQTFDSLPLDNFLDIEFHRCEMIELKLFSQQ